MIILSSNFSVELLIGLNSVLMSHPTGFITKRVIISTNGKRMEGVRVIKIV